MKTRPILLITLFLAPTLVLAQQKSAPQDIVYYQTLNKIYWTDAGTQKIQRANLDGTQVEDLVTTGLDAPYGIVLDPAGKGKIYWTDAGAQKIQRANLDGTEVEDLVTTGLGIPEDIALDPTGGKIYWTDSVTPKIQRANLDGTEVEDLVITGLVKPYGITVDASVGKIYWADPGLYTMKRANLDGTEVEDLVIGLVFPRPKARIPQLSNLTVYFKRPTGWGLPHIDYTSTTPDIGPSTTPGEPMKHEGCGWYSYQFEGASAASFTFNGYPASGSETVSLSRNRSGYFSPDATSTGLLTGTWSDANPEARCTDEIFVTLRAFLAGPYDSSTHLMKNELQDKGLLPTVQPFRDSFFNGTERKYNGTETSAKVASGIRSSTIDWVLVELRTVADDPTSIQAVQAGLLFENGSILDAGSRPMTFKVPGGTYHIVLRTRNHLSVMSPALRVTDNFIVHDFTKSPSGVGRDNSMVELEPGIWGLWGGDGNADDGVTVFDIVYEWEPIYKGPPGYYNGDFDMDGQATMIDYIRVWLPAHGIATTVR